MIVGHIPVRKGGENWGGGLLRKRRKAGRERERFRERNFKKLREEGQSG